MSNVTNSSTAAIAGQNTTIAITGDNLNDGVVPTNHLPRPAQWTPQSRFLRFYSTATFPPSTPLAYVPGDPADWADVPQGGTNRGFFRDLLHFVISKTKSFFERLARINFITPCL